MATRTTHGVALLFAWISGCTRSFVAVEDSSVREDGPSFVAHMPDADAAVSAGDADASLRDDSDADARAYQPDADVPDEPDADAPDEPDAAEPDAEPDAMPDDPDPRPARVCELPDAMLAEAAAAPAGPIATERRAVLLRDVCIPYTRALYETECQCGEPIPCVDIVEQCVAERLHGTELAEAGAAGRIHVGAARSCGVYLATSARRCNGALGSTDPFDWARTGCIGMYAFTSPAIGSPCTGGSAEVCADGTGWCSNGTATVGWFCAPLGEVGDYCAGACAGDAICVKDVCVAPETIGQPSGGACERNGQCAFARECISPYGEYIPIDRACTHPPREGEFCSGEDSCEPGHICRIATRTCGPDTMGTTCDHSDDCGRNTVCVGEQTTVCAAFAGLGEDCSGDEQCEPELECYADTCRARPREGEACANGNCAPGTYCDETTDLCVTGLPISGACAFVRSNDAARFETMCAAGFYCTGYVHGDCVPQLADGATCSDSKQCLSGRCDGTTCRARKADGDRCGSSLECADGSGCRSTADGARCARLGVSGQACTLDDDCLRELDCVAGACIERDYGIGEHCNFDYECAAPAHCRSTIVGGRCDAYSCPVLRGE